MKKQFITLCLAQFVNPLIKHKKNSNTLNERTNNKLPHNTREIAEVSNHYSIYNSGLRSVIFSFYLYCLNRLICISCSKLQSPQWMLSWVSCVHIYHLFFYMNNTITILRTVWRYFVCVQFGGGCFVFCFLYNESDVFVFLF